MFKRLTLLAFLAGASAAHAAAPTTPILPLAQVQPGQKGVGRTVFSGTKIEEFQVEILGVLENVLGPGDSMILAKLEGGPLANTGVIAGMSGSPVFIDGKLIGAVSYGFPFSKETIGGITPIDDMIAKTRTLAPRAASTRFSARFGPGGPQFPLDRATLMSALERPLQTVTADPAHFRGAGLPPGLAGASMRPLSLPLVFSGYEPGVLEWAKSFFGNMGFTPIAGPSAGHMDAAPSPPLEPGSAIGVSLVDGDFDLSATGTVTHIDGDRVYAFGHPFYNLGPTQFPLTKAYVYSVFPSLYSSFKITAPMEPVGTMDQDRSAAIAGHLGAPPQMIPVDVILATSRGQARNFHFRVVEDELLSPVLTYVSLLSALQGSERAFGTSTIRIRASLKLSGSREITIDDLFTEDQPAGQAAALVAAPLSYVMSNDFEPVKVESLKIMASSLETIQSASIQRAWIERNGPIRPGTTVPLRVALRTHRGETRTETVPVAIPANAPDGTYQLLVSDSNAITILEQREMRQPFIPRDLDQLVRAINSLRRNNHLYARLLRSEDGAIVSGEYMQSLPPSVLSVLGSGESGIVPLRTAAVWDADVSTDYVLSGSRLISLTVER